MRQRHHAGIKFLPSPRSLVTARLPFAVRPFNQKRARRGWRLLKIRGSPGSGRARRTWIHAHPCNCLQQLVGRRVAVKPGRQIRLDAPDPWAYTEVSNCPPNPDLGVTVGLCAFLPPGCLREQRLVKRSKTILTEELSSSPEMKWNPRAAAAKVVYLEGNNEAAVTLSDRGDPGTGSY